MRNFWQQFLHKPMAVPRMTDHMREAATKAQLEKAEAKRKDAQRRLAVVDRKYRTYMAGQHS